MKRGFEHSLRFSIRINFGTIFGFSDFGIGNIPLDPSLPGPKIGNMPNGNQTWRFPDLTLRFVIRFSLLFVYDLFVQELEAEN